MSGFGYGFGGGGWGGGGPAFTFGQTFYNGDTSSYLVGGNGNDVFYAGAGDDTVIGGGGNDIINNGDGFDVDVFSGVFGHDIVNDFVRGQDVVRFLHIDPSSLQVAYKEVGGIQGTELSIVNQTTHALDGSVWAPNVQLTVMDTVFIA